MTEAFVGDGEAINSGKYNYLSTPEFKLRIIGDLAEAGLGLGAVNYKLRDWLFSRQRFWGEPFPILHELDAAGKPNGLLRSVPADQLPVNLPELADFKPLGRPEPPLEKAPADWLYPVIDGKKYKRETNTMPQWAGSCWYYLRFLGQQERQIADRSGNRKSVDARRFIHRRRGTCCVASALLAILAQGAVRPRLCEHAGAVYEAGESRNDPGRERREDVEVARQRGQSRSVSSRNTAPIRSGCTKCSWARWKPRSPGAWPASTACSASWAARGG